jgi:serine protease AprX
MVFEDNSHGMGTLSCMGGNLPGSLIGTAPKAKFWLLRTENVFSESWQEEINWLVGAEFADSVGADIISSSLGYSIGMTNPAQDHTYSEMDGKTTIVSKAAEWAARKGIFVTSAAGNSAGPPWYKISAPGDADSILTVGAVDSMGVITSFSSRGPTYDGRIKPNTVARGAYAIIASANGGVDGAYGTSFATPLTAGAVACLLQAHPSSTVIQLLDAIQQSANQYTIPDSIEGYGIPNFCLASNILTGIEKYQLNNVDGLLVYPNPFGTNFNVTFYSDKNQTALLQLIDVSGRIIYNEKKYVNAGSYNTFNSNQGETLSKGIYIFRLVTPDKTLYKKVVKD